MSAGAWFWYILSCCVIVVCTVCAVAYCASAGRQWNPYREWADLGGAAFMLTLSIMVAFNIPGWNG